MVQVHDAHGHVLQAPVFPLLSAPLIAAFGLRGAYLLPGLAFIAMLPLAYLLTRQTATPPGLLAVAASATIASPLFFYALEFWEHAPAVSLAALATWLLARPDQRPVAAGVAIGAAALLRPESTWYGLALVLALARSRAAVNVAAGAAMPIVAFALTNLAEGGTPVGPHAASAMSTLLSNWGSTHVARLSAWLGLASWTVIGGCTLVAGSMATATAGSSMATRRVIGLTGAMVVAIAGASGLAGPDALWRAWPLGLLVMVPAGTRSLLQRRLLVVVGVTTLGVWLTSTHDGGAQWGPRFLLISSPALVALAAMAAERAAAPGPWRTLRVGLVVGLFATGAWNSRAAYLELRGVKEVYSTLVHRVRDAVPEGSYIVTDAWWLNQVAASLQPSRTFLTSESVDGIPAVLEALRKAGVDEATMAWSADPGEPGPLDVLLAGTCWHATHLTEIPERRLTLLAIRCASEPSAR